MMNGKLEAEVGVILSVSLRYPVIRPLRDFPELASSPVTIAIQKKSCRRGEGGGGGGRGAKGGRERGEGAKRSRFLVSQ